jgi:hypothetical protein
VAVAPELGRVGVGRGGGTARAGPSVPPPASLSRRWWVGGGGLWGRRRAAGRGGGGDGRGPWRRRRWAVYALSESLRRCNTVCPNLQLSDGSPWFASTAKMTFYCFNCSLKYRLWQIIKLQRKVWQIVKFPFKKYKSCLNRNSVTTLEGWGVIHLVILWSKWTVVIYLPFFFNRSGVYDVGFRFFQRSCRTRGGCVYFYNKCHSTCICRWLDCSSLSYLLQR